MGADLILTFCPLPSYIDGSLVQTHTQPDDTKYEFVLNAEGARVRAEFIERVRALAPDDVAKMVSECYGDDDEPYEESVDRFIGAYDEIIGPPTGRDVTDLFIGGRWYIFTGGMSWGDTPTNAYDSVNLLATADLLTEPFGPRPAESTA